MKNKKGFTLVELLAVIVILALIMSIAIISIGGVLNSTRQSTMNETAVSIINGVRQQLTIANELDEGDYIFSAALLEKGGKTAPLGGEYQISDSVSSCTGTKIGDNVCRVSTECTAGSKSFVRVSKNASNVYTYSICLLTSGSKSILFDDDATKNSTETNLLDNNNNSMIKDTPSSSGSGGGE